jgi:hypothetical protein
MHDINLKENLLKDQKSEKDENDLRNENLLGNLCIEINRNTNVTEIMPKSENTNFPQNKELKNSINTKHEKEQQIHVPHSRSKKDNNSNEKVVKLGCELQYEKEKNKILESEIESFRSVVKALNEKVISLQMNEKDFKYQIESKNILINELTKSINIQKESFTKKFEEILTEEEQHRKKLIEKLESFNNSREQRGLFDQEISMTKYIENIPKSNNGKLILNHTNIFNQIQPLQVKSNKSFTPKHGSNVDKSKKSNLNNTSNLSNLKTDLMGYDMTYNSPVKQSKINKNEII